MAAFAALPPSKRSRKVRQAIERGAEFYLERGLYREGKSYPPWLRFHYPNHYYYDALLGLDLITDLGFAGDRRLGPALGLLHRKRRPDGRWNLDRAHPDVEGPSAKDYTKSARPLLLENPGEPSKWITLRAMRVLKRVAATA